jgi:hypothetical protein
VQADVLLVFYNLGKIVELEDKVKRQEQFMRSRLLKDKTNVMPSVSSSLSSLPTKQQQQQQV